MTDHFQNCNECAKPGANAPCAGCDWNYKLIERLRAERARLQLQVKALQDPGEPLPMILNCPACGARHVDKGEFATKRHHTHACQGCGLPWRPGVHNTVGVQFLPGFKDPE